MHREYDALTFENDLALLELESPIKFDAHIGKFLRSWLYCIHYNLFFFTNMALEISKAIFVCRISLDLVHVLILS